MRTSHSTSSTYLDMCFIVHLLILQAMPEQKETKKKDDRRGKAAQEEAEQPEVDEFGGTCALCEHRP